MEFKNLLSAVLVFIGSFTTFAQSNLLNAKTPEDIGKKTAAQLESDNDKPLPYGYVHDRDVLMGKMIWENIDLDERVNFPLYFPGDTTDVAKDRRSLFHVLLNGIKSGKITEVYDDDYFNRKKTLADLTGNLRYVKVLDPLGIDFIDNDKKNLYNLLITYREGEFNKTKKPGDVFVMPKIDDLVSEDYTPVISHEYYEEYLVAPKDISGFKIKGFWYFDKRQSEMKYRLLAICPFVSEAKDKASSGTTEPVKLFWVYYPAVRDILHEAKSFNDKNTAMPISFDHLLNSRRFSGNIYKEENVYGDREIENYMKDNALNQLLESERVKEKIRNFESDMWNY